MSQAELSGQARCEAVLVEVWPGTLRLDRFLTILHRALAVQAEGLGRAEVWQSLVEL